MDKIVITDNYSTSSHIVARRVYKEIGINTYDNDIEQYGYFQITPAETAKMRDFFIKALEIINSES